MCTDRVFHGRLHWGCALSSDTDRRNRRRRRISGVLFSLVVAFLIVAPRAFTQSLYFDQRDLQSAVDSLDILDLQGRRWTAAELSGRIVLIDFWATWCAPCLGQIPELKRLRQKHGDQFEILAISLDSVARREMVVWLNRQGVTWPQVHDGRAFNSPAVRPFGVRALPASLLIADGKIAAENLRGRQLEEAVDYLISTRAASPFDFAQGAPR
jgi:thiol-disulfide isomerase/thioredoxin